MLETSLLLKSAPRLVEILVDGDLPIWMTFDAIDALRLANLAVPAPPT